MSARDEIGKILRKVEDWSPHERTTLAHAILETLLEEPAGQKPSIDELIGVGRGKGPPPSDQQVKQWVHEYRMRKYG